MRSNSIADHKPSNPPVLRHELGEVLRDSRQGRSMMLHDVSAGARVSLGYPSEAERGRKEASPELLAAIYYALDIPASFVSREVAGRIALQGGVFVGKVSQTLSVGLLRSLTPAI